jgi:hypothetical protein
MIASLLNPNCGLIARLKSDDCVKKLFHLAHLPLTPRRRLVIRLRLVIVRLCYLQASWLLLMRTE